MHGQYTKHQQRKFRLRGDLRGCQSVEGKEECHEPENCICDLDREFGCREEQRE
jgi:hypothetical protein